MEKHKGILILANTIYNEIKIDKLIDDVDDLFR